jgi:hypothetical protein
MNSRKRPRPRRGALLEIYLDKDELMIMGNKAGLESLSDFISHIATKENLFHEHLGFSWGHELVRKRLIIGLGSKLLTPPTHLRDGYGREVTIMKTDEIGLRFWRKARRHPPHVKLLVKARRRK